MTWNNLPPQQQPQQPPAQLVPPQQHQQQWPGYGQYPYNPASYATPVARPHSRFGIASFVIGLVAIAFLFAMIVAAGVVVAGAGGVVDETSPEMIAIGLGIMGGIVMSLVGVVFAIVGLGNRNVAKVFPILGLVFNSLAIIAVIGLMVIGAAA